MILVLVYNSGRVIAYNDIIWVDSCEKEYEIGYYLHYASNDIEFKEIALTDLQRWQLMTDSGQRVVEIDLKLSADDE